MPTSNNSRLLAEGRRRKILELVEQSGQVTIHDVVKRFAVSAVTARSDLDALSANGAVLRCAADCPLITKDGEAIPACEAHDALVRVVSYDPRLCHEPRQGAAESYRRAAPAGRAPRPA